MINKFIQTITDYKLIEKNDSVILGLSGGADSVCLLNLFIRVRDIFDLKIIAVHIHHGLRGCSADSDLNFCKNICKDLNVPLETYHFNIKEIAAEHGISLEEAGREKRYETFRDIAKKHSASKIAVAHNMNDQAETLIMRLFRGTGLKGLAGMRPFADGIIRPLLFVSRNEIENYCLVNNLLYIVDLSNFNTDYTRCNIRQTVIPKVIKEFNSNIIDTLSRTANILNDENEFLEMITEQHYHLCVSDKGININELKKMDLVIQRRVIRRAISEFTMKDVSYGHVNIALELINKPTGKMVNLPGRLIIQRNYEYLTVSSSLTFADYDYRLCPNSDIYISEIGMYLSIKVCQENFYEFSHKTEYTNSFDYDKIVQTVKLRNRRSGDLLHVNGMNKKLKKYFIDKKVPRSVRSSIPLLADGQNIICIIPGISSDLYKVTGETKNILHIGVFYESKEE